MPHASHIRSSLKRPSDSRANAGRQSVRTRSSPFGATLTRLAQTQCLLVMIITMRGSPPKTQKAALTLHVACASSWSTGGEGWLPRLLPIPSGWWLSQPEQRSPKLRHVWCIGSHALSQRLRVEVCSRSRKDVYRLWTCDVPCRLTVTSVFDQKTAAARPEHRPDSHLSHARAPDAGPLRDARTQLVPPPVGKSSQECWRDPSCLW